MDRLQVLVKSHALQATKLTSVYEGPYTFLQERPKFVWFKPCPIDMTSLIGSLFRQDEQ